MNVALNLLYNKKDLKFLDMRRSAINIHAENAIMHFPIIESKM